MKPEGTWRPEPKLEFTYAELVTAMLKARGIREGRWTVSIGFGLGAMTTHDDHGNLYPTAMIPIKSVGLKPVADSEPDGPNVVNAREVSSSLILPRASA